MNADEAAGGGEPNSGGAPAGPDGEADAITQEEDGQTLAAVVRARLGMPWRRAKDLCASGRVRLDGARAVDPAQRVSAGMRLELAPTARRVDPGALQPEDVAFVDGAVLVVDKPAGLLTIAYDDEDERDTLTERAVRYLKGARGRRAGRDPRVEVVQRLDKDTSGVLVLARTEAAKDALKEQLLLRTVTRRYLALVHGHARSTTFSTLLVQDRGDGLRGSFGARPHHRGEPPHHAKPARTHVRVIERLEGASLVECRLETGRQHQIRIHLSEAGHMLIGETVYVREHAGPPIAAPRLMLHATELAFDHPVTKERLSFSRPPPADFVEVYARLAGR